MGGQWQTTFHALMVGWHLLMNVYLAFIGIHIMLSRWDYIKNQFGAGIQYFTIWNFGMQQGYFILSLKEDMLPASCRIKPKLHKFLTLAFHALIFPMSMIVALDFWVAYSLDPSLLDEHNMLPNLTNANHAVHTTIVPIVLLELVISDRPRKSISLVDIFFHLLFVHLMYQAVILAFYQIAHVWPYPFLAYLSIAQMTGLCFLNSLVGVTVAFVGYAAKNHLLRALETLVKFS